MLDVLVKLLECCLRTTFTCDCFLYFFSSHESDVSMPESNSVPFCAVFWITVLSLLSAIDVLLSLVISTLVLAFSTGFVCVSVRNERHVIFRSALEEFDSFALAEISIDFLLFSISSTVISHIVCRKSSTPS